MDISGAVWVNGKSAINELSMELLVHIMPGFKGEEKPSPQSILE